MGGQRPAIVRRRRRKLRTIKPAEIKAAEALIQGVKSAPVFGNSVVTARVAWGGSVGVGTAVAGPCVGLAVGRVGSAVGGTGVGGIGVGGMGVGSAVGGKDVGVGILVGVRVGTVWRNPLWLDEAHAPEARDSKINAAMTVRRMTGRAADRFRPACMVATPRWDDVWSAILLRLVLPRKRAVHRGNMAFANGGKGGRMVLCNALRVGAYSV